MQPAGSPRGSAAARPVDGSKLLGQFLTERGRHGGVGWFLDALSLNPWMGDFVWSLTRFPERRPGMGTVAHA